MALIFVVGQARVATTASAATVDTTTDHTEVTNSAPTGIQPESVDPRPLNAPTATVSFNMPSAVFLGEDFTFEVLFENNGDAPGYGPFVDVIFPVTGQDGDDGIDFVSATYAGASIELVAQTFPDDGTGSGCVDHPWLRDSTGAYVQVCGTAGDKLVSFRLPFGSFVPGQPPAAISITASLSNLADISPALTLKARGGYMYGTTPLDDWCCGDTPIAEPATNDGTGWPSASVTPAVMTMEKIYNGPANTSAETATGPNYPRSYDIKVDIATGQTVDNLNIVDTLPNDVQFTSYTVTGATVATVNSVPSTTTPGGTLDLTLNAVTGAAGNDVTVTIHYYVPRLDAGSAAVIDPTTGAAVASTNTATVQGDWTPIDPRDSATTLTADGSPGTVTVQHRSLAIQKSVANVSDATNSPGDVFEYTLEIQVSDFFAFDNLVVTDVISDGQHVDSTFIPTVQVNGNGFTMAATSFTTGNYDIACDYSGTAGPECITDNTAAPNSGQTTLTFNVSDELATQGLDSRLVGGCVDPANGSNPPDCNTYNDGTTTVTIVFRTILQESFTDTAPSGDNSVDQGDTFDDTATAAADLLDTITFTPGPLVTDDATASFAIGRGNLNKTIYAVNGSTSLPVDSNGNVIVKPGDEVTYRLTYDLTTSDVEALTFVDYLPLPVFDVADPNADGTAGPSWSFSSAGGIPTSGVVTLGPSDTFYSYMTNGLSNGTGTLTANANNTVPTQDPVITSDAAGNSISIFYADYDDTRNQSSVVDLLFTVTVSAEPFADGLFLTNQAQVSEGSTNAGSSSADAIVQIKLTEPVLVGSKGVVWTSNPNATFDAALGPGGVTFLDPTNAPRWSGTINSSGLAANPIDANVSGVDAGDIVTFAITIENQGTSLNGAFDITLRDILDTAFYQIPTGGINLQVYYGDGSGPISWSGLGGGPDGTNGTEDDLFGNGIELIDPVGQGVCQAHDPNLGNNVILITYDLQVRPDVTPGQALNTMHLMSYAGEEGGPNHLAQDITDDATATVLADFTKTLVGTEVITANNGNTDVVIGELVTYKLTATVPEGAIPNARIDDQLDGGLAYVACTSVIPYSNGVPTTDVTTDLASGADFSGVCANDVTVTNSGATISFALGNITNSNLDDTATETIEIIYQAVVLNVVGNQGGTLLNNAAEFFMNDGTADTSLGTGAAPNVTVLEPQVDTVKSVSPATTDAGNTVTFTVTLSNTSNVDAFDVSWQDTIPAGLNYVAGSLTGSCTVHPISLNDAAAPILSATVADIDVGETCTINFDAVVDYGVAPGQALTNTADTSWTSMALDPGQRSSFNADSVERTGADGVGGLNDYVSSGSATVTVSSVAPTKYLMTTSEDHTSGSNGAIGEIVRFRLVVLVPEGTSANFQLVDVLPPGLTFLNDGSARIGFVSNGGGITSTAIGVVPALTGCTVAGNAADNTTPASSALPCALADGNIADTADINLNTDAYSSGTDVYFRLGDLVNNDSDADAEYVVLEFNALVDNTVNTNAGDVLSNQFHVTIGGTQNGSASNTVDVTVVEPHITVDKSLVTAAADAGDQMVYRISITNDATGAGAAAAFDLTLTDTLNTYLNLNLGGVTVYTDGTNGSTTLAGSCGSTAQTVTDNSGSGAGATVQIDITCLNPGEKVVVDIAATVDISAPAGLDIPNTANGQASSLPGNGTPNGSGGNNTGSSTPGAAGTDTGERDGSGGVNDYAGSGTVSQTLSTPVLTKSVESPGEFVIGEQFNYYLVVTLPEGVTQSLEVYDNLPVGLAYAGHQIITTAAASNGLLAGDFSGSSVSSPGVTVTSGSGGDLTLTFGDVTVPADGNPNNDSFLVVLTATVLNVSSNQDGLRLTNTGQVSWTNPNTGLTDSQTDTRDIAIVEPTLTLAKSVDDTTWIYGQTLTYTLNVAHATGSSVDAYDVVVVDTIPTGLTYVPGSMSAPTGCTANDSGAPTLRWYCFSLSPGNTLTLTYQATVDSPPSATALTGTDVVTNTADLSWTSLPGIAPGERDGSGAVSGDAWNDYYTSASATGGLEYYAIGNRVWFDTNNNAQIDTGEVGASGVVVELYAADAAGNPTGAPLASDVTDASGYYLFDYLEPGDYVVVVSADNFTTGGALEGYWSSQTSRNADGSLSETTAATANSDIDSDDNGTLQTSGDVISSVVTLGPSGDTEPTGETDFANGVSEDSEQPDGRSNLTIDFGFYQTAIGNLVFMDNDTDGNYDSAAGDTIVSGAAVELFAADGTTSLATTTTDASGFYRFSGLPEGDYIVKVTAPSGTVSTIDAFAAADTTDPNTNTDNNDNGVGTSAGVTAANPVTMTAGDSGAAGNNTVDNATGTTFNPTVDFGFTYAYAIGNRVWFDTDNSSALDTGEVGVDGVTVELYAADAAGNPTGAALATVTTANGGYYLFDNLLPGDYVVVIPASNFADGAVLSGYWSSATVMQDSGAMQETRATGATDDDVDSDDNGLLTAGDVISVAITLGPGASSEPTGETDLNGGSQGTPPDGRANMTVDFGFYQTQLGNLIFGDANENGAYDSGTDTLYSNVIVQLFAYGTDGTDGGEINIGPDGILGTSDDAAGGVLSNASGEYRFSGLPEGRYVVKVTAPNGTVSTIDTFDAADNADPNTNTDNNDNGVGQLDGVVTANPVTMTAGASGAQNNNTVDNAAGVTFNPTVDFGFTTVYALGNRVWFDTNNNAVIDGTEAGVDGVTVELYAADAAGNPTGTALATDVTANGGYYLFDYLNAGDYVVVIPASNFASGAVLEGYWSSTVSRQNDGSLTETAAADPDNDADSDDNGFTAASGDVVAQAVTLGPTAVEPTGETDLDGGSQGAQPDAQANMTVDFGFYTITLGNQVWDDSDNSGLLDGAEVGIDGVTVELRTADDATVLATTTTAGGGFYTFTGLPAGSYIVRLPEANFQTTGALRDYYSSTGNGVPAPNPDADTTDSDDNGDDVGTLGFPGGYITTGAFALTPAGEASVDNATGTTNEPRVDFGVFNAPQTDLSITKDDGVTFYLAGSTLTYTITVTNNGPADVTGAVITDVIPPQIASWDWTCTTVTGGATGCDGVTASTTDFTDTVNLPYGGSITYTVTATVDAAATGPLVNTVTVDAPTSVVDTSLANNTAVDTDQAAAISVTKDDGVTAVAPNGQVTYTITVTNIGAVDLTDLTVTDTLPADMTFVSATPAPSSVTGNILVWTHADLGLTGPLTPGASVSITLTAQVSPIPNSSLLTNTVAVADAATGAAGGAGDTDVVVDTMSKALIGTNQGDSAGLDVFIGEILTYEVSLTIPDGVTLNDLQLVDVLHDGLAFDECISVNAGALTTDRNGGFAAACPLGGDATNPDPAVSNGGRNITMSFGNVTNASGTAQTLTVQYQVVVLNISSNYDGVSGLNNNASWNWNGNTSSLSDSAAGVSIIEPDMDITKDVSPSIAPLGSTVTFTLEIYHTTASTADAYDVIVTDILPSGLEYVDGSLTVTGLAPDRYNYDTVTRALTFEWDHFPLTATSTLTFDAVFVGPAPVVNSANVAWTSLPLDPGVQSEYNPDSTERWYDPADLTGLNSYNRETEVRLDVPALPETGFAPGRVTTLPQQPEGKQYANLGDMRLEIPALGVEVPIIGVPLGEEGWDLTWLADQAGWLEGTAYPTWEGNTALTGHVYLADGTPGPFVNLGSLYWGQRIIIYAYGQQYVYEVRSVRKVYPDNLSVLQHKDRDWLTLITCKDYNESQDAYTYRIAVQAVLVEVTPAP